MASFLATSACPVGTFSVKPLPNVRASHHSSFLVNGGPLFIEPKYTLKMKLSKTANVFSTRRRCSRTTISCSAQPETLTIVQSTIAKQLSIDVSTVTPETNFADLGADSLDTVEIMMALEEQFGVSVGESGAENIATVQDAADLIEEVKAAAA